MVLLRFMCGQEWENFLSLARLAYSSGRICWNGFGWSCYVSSKYCYDNLSIDQPSKHW